MDAARVPVVPVSCRESPAREPVPSSLPSAWPLFPGVVFRRLDELRKDGQLRHVAERDVEAVFELVQEHDRVGELMLLERDRHQGPVGILEGGVLRDRSACVLLGRVVLLLLRYGCSPA